MTNEQLREKIAEFITPLVNGLAHIKKAGEAHKAGQDDVLEKVERQEKGQKAMREDMATKTDIKRLEQKVDQTIKDHEERIEHLEGAHHKN